MLAFLSVFMVVGGRLFLGSAQEEGVQVFITRSEDGDVVSGSCNKSCNDTFSTYLVEERECANSTDLNRGNCLSRLANVSDISNGHSSSNCEITELAVVRGRSDWTRIDHDGFSAVTGGTEITVFVNKSGLAYDESEYAGELYRITCNAMVDCVFFKLNGTTSVTRSKFNESVSPTNLDPCPTTASSSINSSSDGPTTDGGGGILDDPILRYIIICSTGGISILICLIIITCCAICCLLIKRRKKAASRRLNLRGVGLSTFKENYNHQNSSTRAPDITDATAEEQITEDDDEEHAYAMVEEAQAEMEEVKRKEVRDAKFQYASVTFDTFKPAPGEQSAAEPEEHEHRLPSFARNFNPIANRAMLARSYEIVTPMGAPKAEAGTKPSADGTDLQLEEYDKLIHQERKMTSTSTRKMTGASQRNFSISTRVKETKPNYSQLELTTKANSQEASELGVKRIKPGVKNRNLIKADVEDPPSKIPSYSLVKKPKAPPLPPRYDYDIQEEEVKEEAPQEEHYKVPRSVRRREQMNTYDRPSSLVRVAWSCENIRSQSRPLKTDPHTTTASGDLDFYDAPAIFPRGRGAHSQRSLLHNEPMYANNVAEVLQNSASVGSYIDMTGSQVSYI